MGGVSVGDRRDSAEGAYFGGPGEGGGAEECCFWFWLWLRGCGGNDTIPLRSFCFEFSGRSW